MTDRIFVKYLDVMVSIYKCLVNPVGEILNQLFQSNDFGQDNGLRLHTITFYSK